MKKPAAFFTKDLNILWAWPVFCEIAVALVFDDIGQLSFQEQLDIAVHKLRFDLMESEHIYVRLK